MIECNCHHYCLQCYVMRQDKKEIEKESERKSESREQKEKKDGEKWEREKDGGGKCQTCQRFVL